ncbi:MAG: polyprenyl synthetase family protein [Deltaproteobacteria bacterium]|nr:polyprenyl synthetase family protein [Deltaproteobacteria bacterium]
MQFDLEHYFKECQALVNEALDSSLPKKELHPPKVHEAMRYSIFAGGKRIRPILCMAASEACGGGRREVLPIACALEMIHTFSLIHDDLPAMDDDSLRRGVPTNHKVFGEAVAILAGDALLSQAFLVLGKLKDSLRDPRCVLEIIYHIASATGSMGMVGGQVLDMEAEGNAIDLPALRKLHQLKTGRLIAASVLSGALMAEATDQKLAAGACQPGSGRLAAIESYGEAVGLAFQIADDILDIVGGSDLGKDIGSDAENKKATYPSVMGMEGAKKAANIAKEEALGSLNGFGPEADALRAIAEFIVERRK